MKNTLITFSSLVCILFSCQQTTQIPTNQAENKNLQTANFKIAFGSCNKQDLPQNFWATIQKDSADLFIWGGDNIYADTDDMQLMQSKYKMQNSNSSYQNFVSTLPYGIAGVWDDHDYGKNDAGKEWAHKEQSQSLFMKFMGLDTIAQIANTLGTYYLKKIQLNQHQINLYMLDTRFFRDGINRAQSSSKKYQPHSTTDSTLLGYAQWKWLEEEFASSTADVNIIVSSIQFLSSEHGFETWGNFPHEVEKMQQLILNNKLKNVLFISGDRHLSEFSQKNLSGLSYPLTDFTSSGLTHSYTSFTGEPNQYRVGEVISQTSYGLIDLNLNSQTAHLQMKSTSDGEVLQELRLQF